MKCFSYARAPCARGLLANPGTSLRQTARFLQIQNKQRADVAKGGFAIKVNVARVEQTDPATKGMIEQIEDKQANAERSVFEQASTCPLLA